MNQHPNIVILCQEHCNSSIVANMLATAGWKRNDMDEHGESLSVRELNGWIIRNCGSGLLGFEKKQRAVLEVLEQPWVLKDPRFRMTLQYWDFIRYTPILLYLKKDAEKIQQSYHRRSRPEWGRPYPMSLDTIAEWERQCRKQYEMWPMKKIQLNAEDIGLACGMFSAERSAGRTDAILGKDSSGFVCGNEFVVTCM